MKPLHIAGLTLGFCLAASASAKADIITTTSTPTLPADNYTDPNSTDGNVIVGATGTETQGGGVAGYSPYGDSTSKYVDIVNGSATYVTGPTNQVAFVWGSPDSYNTVTLYNGSTAVGSVTGSSITGNSYVTLTDTTSTFDRVVFSSSQAAFEVADVSPVPLPPALYLFMAALAGLGGLAYFRKRPEDGSFAGASAA